MFALLRGITTLWLAVPRCLLYSEIAHIRLRRNDVSPRRIGPVVVIYSFLLHDSKVWVQSSVSSSERLHMMIGYSTRNAAEEARRRGMYRERSNMKNFSAKRCPQ